MNLIYRIFIQLGYVRQGKKNFILVPVAFVNEHIETLHELDIEYCKELGEEVCYLTAHKINIQFYLLVN